MWLGIRGSRSIDSLQRDRGFTTAQKATEIQEPLVPTRMAIAMGHSLAGCPAEAFREYGAALASATLRQERLARSPAGSSRRHCRCWTRVRAASTQKKAEADYQISS